MAIVSVPGKRMDGDFSKDILDSGYPTLKKRSRKKKGTATSFLFDVSQIMKYQGAQVKAK